MMHRSSAARRAAGSPKLATLLAFVSTVTLSAGCAREAEDGSQSGQPEGDAMAEFEHAEHGSEGTASATRPGGVAGVPLYDDLGDHQHAISTDSPEAQAYFDQGLRLQYAFNHAEAIRSFEAALELDPECAMCLWGIALASGPNINAPMDPESGARAYESIQTALELAESVSESEQAYIRALTARFGPDPESDRVQLDSAYARAMAEVADAYPDDADARTLYAASLMNLSPWNYWSGSYGDRRPNPGTETIVAQLEGALELEPNNPGACHYYIHSVEAAYPKRAVECADRLAALMPGAGHIVHMPGHIYIRVGRYADAVAANEHAVHSDETFISDQRPTGLYPTAYYPHNYHFMAFAATMAGMSDRALEAARIVAPKIPLDVALAIYWIQNAVVLPSLTLVSFGRWNEVLEEPLPPAELKLATALAHYTRGIAFAATDRFDEAEAVLSTVREIAAAGAEQEDSAIDITVHALQGEIALRLGDPQGAVRHFQTAAEIEDSMLYEEPPLWYYPVRHSLGRALLEAGRAEDAEAAYREDLLRFPENGWALFGLALSLEAQGRAEEAAGVRARFEQAWADADAELIASRF
jgi:tetratricopeptide (TPR) repeat protein